MSFRANAISVYLDALVSMVVVSITSAAVALVAIDTVLACLG